MKNRMLGVSLLALLASTGCGAGTEPTSGEEAAEALGAQSSALATTNDLTVGYIQRVPVMNWVQGSTNPKVEGWPAVGQNVTWRGFVRNLSGTARNGVQYRWLWDGAQVATGSVNIAANGTASVDYVRAWDFTRHDLKLVIDTANAVSEDEEGNNELSVVTNALSVGLWVEQSVYDYFKAHQRDLSGVHSTCWDNWAQRQVSQWNSMLYAGAVYPESPQGVLDRVRLDKITIVPDHALPLSGGLSTNDPDLNDHSVDLEWGFPADSVSAGNTWYADTTTISLDNPFYYEKGLPHELGHARYLIDNYGFNVHQQANGQGRDGIPQTENGAPVYGTPFMPFVGIWSDAVYYTHQNGLMSGDYLYMDRYSAVALNLISGARATQGNVNAPGNLGAFLNDLPAQNQVTLTDAASGSPLAGAQVRIYQSTGNGQLYGKNFSATPAQTLTADSTGKIVVGHNPFTAGSISPWHENTDILLRVQHQNRVRYVFMEASDYNLEYWRGHTSLGQYALSVDFQPGAVVSNSPVTGALTVTSDDSNGYCAKVILTNGGSTATANWQFDVTLPNVVLSSSYNGIFTPPGNGAYNIKPFSWNPNVAPGAAFDIQYCADKTGGAYQPSVTGVTAQCGASSCNSQLSAQMSLQSDWSTGYCANIHVQNTGSSQVTSWQINATYPNALRTSSSNGQFVPASTAPYQVKAFDWDKVIQPGATQEIGFCANKVGGAYQPTLGSVSSQ